ncbi:MAG: hypothetical protein R2800_03985 [Flavipsychrobacter sp.]
MENRIIANHEDMRSKLDLILKLLYKHSHINESICIETLLHKAQQEDKSFSKDGASEILNQILVKLLKDGYATIYYMSTPIDELCFTDWIITLEGIAYHGEGGYTGKYNSRKLLKFKDISVIALTLLIGVATVYTSWLQYGLQKKAFQEEQNKHNNSVPSLQLKPMTSDSTIQSPKNQNKTTKGVS